MAFALISKSKSPTPQQKLSHRRRAANAQCGSAKVCPDSPATERTTMAVIQAKLKVGAPNDRYEQEAERVADQVMSMPKPVALPQPVAISPSRLDTAQRKCAACQRGAAPCPNCEAKQQTGPVSDKMATETPLHPAVSGFGKPLDPATRTFMESRIGSDFGPVRIHTGTQAARSATALSARAYTFGRDIVFGAGEYQNRPSRLLAHELVHVVQQGAALSTGAPVTAVDLGGSRSVTRVGSQRFASTPQEQNTLQRFSAEGIFDDIGDYIDKNTSRCRIRYFRRVVNQANLSWPALADYGNWCGKGGSGRVQDAFDECCEEHDNCYGRQLCSITDVACTPGCDDCDNAAVRCWWKAIDDDPTRFGRLGMVHYPCVDCADANMTSAKEPRCRADGCIP